MSDGVNLGSARGEISLSIDPFVKAIKQAQDQLKGFQSGSEGIGKALDGVAKNAAVIGGGLALGIGAAVHAFGDFEHQMNAVAAVTGATGAEFDALKAKAIEIGKNTVFSASEAASALEELAKAGVSTKDILSGAADGATALAAAAGEGIPQAATQIANALNEFGLAGDQATHIADVFANVANKSAADATDFGDALTYVGTQAHALGVPIEDVAAAVAVMADQGLKGSHAGTALGEALSSLAAPTRKQADELGKLGVVTKDAQGNFVGLTSIIEQVSKATAGMGNVQRSAALETAFGVEGARAMNALLNTQSAQLQAAGKGWDDYGQAVREQGTAAEQAATRNKGLQGAIEAMKGSIETAAIAFGAGLAPAIEKGAALITSLANAFTALPPRLQEIAAGTVGAAAGLALVAAATAKTISFAIDTVGAWRQMVTAIRESEFAMAALDLAFGPVGIAVAALAVGIGILVKHHLDAAAAAKKQEDAIRSLNAELGDFSKFVDSLKLEGAQEAADAVEQLVRDLTTGVVKLRETHDWFEKNTDVATTAAQTLGAVVPQQLLDRIDALNTALPQMQEALRTPGINVESLSRDFDVLVEQLINGGISITDFNGHVQDITTHLIRYKSAAKGAGDGTDQLTAAQERAKQAAEEAAKAQAAFQAKVDGVAGSAIRQIKGLDDMSSSLDGLQTGYQRVGESAADALLRMDRLGKIDLSPADEQALHLANHLADAQANIDKVDASIQQNQQDLSTWADRIKTVTDVFGGNTDELDRWIGMVQTGQVTQQDFNAALESGAITGNFDKLDALLASGAISQDKYNKAKKAGIDLIERSVGGEQDESAALADNIIALDKYVQLHDQADGAVKNLTDEQQGFLAAMNSSAGATALQTLQILEYLAATGQIPPEKVTDFIADASQADPVVAALFKDLGLIPDDKTTTFSVVGDGTQKLAGAVSDRNKLDKPVTVTLDFTATGDGTQQLDQLESDVDSGKTIPVKLGAPDAAAVDAYNPDPIVVPTSLSAPLTDLVDNYHHDPIKIGTTLEAPLDDLVTGYKPPTIEIPTELQAPSAPSGGDARQPEKTLSIPTALEAPDTAAVYSPAAPYADVEIPTKFGPPDDTFVYRPDGERVAVEIPTKLGAPDAAAVTDYKPATITAPTRLATPDVSALTDFKPPAAIVVPSALDTPDDSKLTAYKPATIFVPVTLETPKAAEGSTFKGPDAITVPINADRTGFDKVLGDAIIAAVGFQATTFTTTISGDSDDFFTAFNEVIEDATTFNNDTYTTTVDADTTQATDAIEGLVSAINGLTSNTYSVTITADTSLADAAIAALANKLPHSPAKEGPLSKTPSFDYVAESLAKSLGVMEKATVRSMGEIADALGGSLAGPRVDAALRSLVADSLRGADLSVHTLGGLSAVPLRAGGTTTIINHNYAVNVLRSEEWLGYVEKAEKGSLVYDHVAESGRRG
jgi:TP901 family phage tail tape measure protein